MTATDSRWDFRPFCPFRPGELCNYKCALAVKVDGGKGMMACALAVMAARGTDHGVNVTPGPRGSAA